MKIKFGDQEVNIVRMFDTMERRETCMRQVTVTVDESKDTMQDLYAVLDENYTNGFVLVKEEGAEEIFDELPKFMLSRNVEKSTEQVTICFSK